MYDVIEKLMVNYLQPVVDILYKCRGLGKLDSHKSFTVSYAKYGDQGLRLGSAKAMFRKLYDNSFFRIEWISALK